MLKKTYKAMTRKIDKLQGLFSQVPDFLEGKIDEFELIQHHGSPILKASDIKQKIEEKKEENMLQEGGDVKGLTQKTDQVDKQTASSATHYKNFRLPP